MATTQEVSELKINYLSDTQYKDALKNNQINTNEIYMTPTESSQIFVGATTTSNGQEGLVPAPESGNVNRYLRADGAWSALSSASRYSSGLMSATDKSHHDEMYTALSDEITQSQVEALFA